MNLTPEEKLTSEMIQSLCESSAKLGVRPEVFFTLLSRAAALTYSLEWIETVPAAVVRAGFLKGSERSIDHVLKTLHGEEPESE